MKKEIIAIVPAAGLGRRFGGPVRKPFSKVVGIPLLIHTLKSLHRSKYVTEIIPVLRKRDIKRGLELIRSHKIGKVKQVAPGGRERQDSVYNALCLLKKECLVLVHDGVRPFIRPGLIERLIKGIRGVDGVIPGLPVNETLKKADSKGFVLSTVNRNEYMTIQTPQVFRLGAIRNAYDKAYKDGFNATDDASVVERAGGRIRIIEGDPLNIKVTTPEDMEIVKCVLKKKRPGRLR